MLTRRNRFAGKSILRRGQTRRSTEATDHDRLRRTLIPALHSRGMDLEQMATELNRLGLPSPQRGRWNAAILLSYLVAQIAAPSTEPANDARMTRQSAQAVKPYSFEETKRLILSLMEKDLGYGAIAQELTDLSIPAPRGGAWNAATVRNYAISWGVPVQKSRSAGERRAKYRPILLTLWQKGLNFSEIAKELDRQGIPSPRGRTWNDTTVRSYLLDSSPDLPAQAKKVPTKAINDALADEDQNQEARSLILSLGTQGYKWLEIAEALDRRGIPAPQSEKWNQVTVRNYFYEALARQQEAPKKKGISAERNSTGKLLAAIDVLLKRTLSWPRIATDINAQGFRTPLGEPWLGTHLKVYVTELRRHQ